MYNGKDGGIMAKREQYVAIIECKGCRAKAEAEFDEVENPAHNNWDLDQSVTSVGPPLQIENGRVVCGECGSDIRGA